MDTLPNELLAEILSRLDFQSKFAAIRVSKRWKQLCEQVIKAHKRLAIGTRHVDSLFPLAPDHRFQSFDLVPEALVAEKNSDCWRHVISRLSEVTGLRVDCKADGFIRSLMQSQHKSLTAVICPNWTFACDIPLPQLVLLTVDYICESSFSGLFVESPKLAAITFSRTNFRDWNRLPHGLLSLTSGELAHPPFDLLFSSPAAETLERLSIRSSILSLNASYELPQLRELEVGGYELLDDNVILNWSQSLSGSKNLLKLHFSTPVDNQHLAAAVLWNTFFSSVSGIHIIYLNLRCHRLEPMTQIISSLVENCGNIREITLPYSNIADSDMETVGRLTKLQKFLLYCNSGRITEAGIRALLQGESANTLNQVHVYNNYKIGLHSPPMATNRVREAVAGMPQLMVQLEYLDDCWQRE